MVGKFFLWFWLENSIFAVCGKNNLSGSGGKTCFAVLAEKLVFTVLAGKFVRFWRETCFRFWREQYFCEFLAEKLSFPVLTGKLGFPVLVSAE